MAKKKKTNLILFLVFVGLLVFTYFYEEIGSQQRRREQEQQLQVIDAKRLGKLKEFKTPEVHLIQKNGEFFTKEGRFPVDEAKLQHVFGTLSSIQLKRKLSSAEIKDLEMKEFFPEDDLVFTFIFENGEVNYL